jgi:hypothetical protein
MKTITQVQAEIDAILSQNAPNTILEPRKHAAATKRLAFLRTCRAYLNSGPDPDFIQSEVNRIATRLGLISEQYDLWLPDRTFDSLKQRREAYDRMFGVKELETQLKTLEYLLS